MKKLVLSIGFLLIAILALGAVSVGAAGLPAEALTATAVENITDPHPEVLSCSAEPADTSTHATILGFNEEHQGPPGGGGSCTGYRCDYCCRSNCGCPEPSGNYNFSGWCACSSLDCNRQCSWSEAG